MRSARYLLILLLLVSTCALTQAETKDDAKKPSWLERIFGSKESESEKQTEADEKAKDTGKAEIEKQRNKEKQFTNEERALLESWQKGEASWKKKDKQLPPGLQKKVDRGGELPPGWQKKLEIGSTLETDLDEQARSLPEEILKRLPQAPENTEIIQIGDEIVRVIENTREIVDILSNIGGSDEN